MEDTIYFYLPGIVENFEQTILLVQRIQDYPDHFYDNVKIGAVFGCPPGAKWNGGRHSLGTIDDDKVEYFVEMYNSFGVPIRYTWTNPVLTEEDLQDEYCNWVTKVSENGLNEILVNNDQMENYIRENYPKYPIISSTTKRITDIDGLNEELGKDYKLVVVDYDFNNDWENLDKIIHPEKCELLINPVCNPHCPFRKKHYELIGGRQRGEKVEHNEAIDGCPAQMRLFNEIKALPTFISKEDIWNKYIPRGFRHFKIEGRCVSPLKSLEWCLYYLVKPEYMDEERSWLYAGFETTLLQPNIPIYPK